jgi:hypothetical protein
MTHPIHQYRLTLEQILERATPANFEKIRGIYFLLENDELVYIGQSTNIMARISHHIADPDKSFNQHTIMPVVPEVSLNDLEAILILKYKPKYNTSIPVNAFFCSKETARKRYGIPGNIMNKAIRAEALHPIYLAGRVYFELRELVQLAPAGLL